MSPDRSHSGKFQLRICQSGKQVNSMTFLNRLVSYGCTKSEALRRKILTPPFPKIIPVNNLDTLGSEWGKRLTSHRQI